MRYLSLFSGIGGFELGIDKAWECQGSERSRGIQHLRTMGDMADISEQPRNRTICVGYSEIDKYAIKVYERHYGQNSRMARERECDCSTQRRQKTLNGERTGLSQINGDMHHDTNCSYTKSDNNGGHKNYGDATTITASELPDFDLLVGGFPCQAFSIAGKRRGFDDTRGTLFFDIARILAEKRPRHLVLENVKGLLSHDSGKTFQTILGVLSDLGYRVEWQVLNSKDFGVPQNRERIYFVGHLRGECSGQVFPITGKGGNDTRVVGKEVARTIEASYYKGVSPNGHQGAGRQLIHQLNNPTHSNDRVYGDDGISPTLNTMQGGARQPFVAPVLTPDRAEKRQNGRRMKDNGEPAFTVTAQDKHGLYDGTRIRRLTPLECERLQGFPDNFTKYDQDGNEISDTQRYKMCGNAVTVNVVEAVMTNLRKECYEKNQLQRS